jgi:hypothetical protein
MYFIVIIILSTLQLDRDVIGFDLYEEKEFRQDYIILHVLHN